MRLALLTSSEWSCIVLEPRCVYSYYYSWFHLTWNSPSEAYGLCVWPVSMQLTCNAQTICFQRTVPSQVKSTVVPGYCKHPEIHSATVWFQLLCYPPQYHNTTIWLLCIQAFLYTFCVLYCALHVGCKPHCTKQYSVVQCRVFLPQSTVCIFLLCGV